MTPSEFGPPAEPENILIFPVAGDRDLGGSDVREGYVSGGLPYTTGTLVGPFKRHLYM